MVTSEEYLVNFKNTQESSSWLVWSLSPFVAIQTGIEQGVIHALNEVRIPYWVQIPSMKAEVEYEQC